MPLAECLGVGVLSTERGLPLCACKLQEVRLWLGFVHMHQTAAQITWSSWTIWVVSWKRCHLGIQLFFWIVQCTSGQWQSDPKGHDLENWPPWSELESCFIIWLLFELWIVYHKHVWLEVVHKYTRPKTDDRLCSCIIRPASISLGVLDEDRRVAVNWSPTYSNVDQVTGKITDRAAKLKWVFELETSGGGNPQLTPYSLTCSNDQ